MSEFNTLYNFNDCELRNIILSVLYTLNDKVKYKQYKDNNIFDEITVPFFYSLTGAEDFLVDNFMNEEYSKYSEAKLDGIYEKVPRGVINLTSLEIDSGALINKNIRCTIPKKVDETTFKMYSYETMIIPINMTFDVRINCNSNIEMFKITLSLIKNLYKTNPFSVDYGGYKHRGNMIIPESFEQEKQFEFSYTDKKTYDITFSLDVNTDILIFDENTEIFAGSRIEKFELGIFDMKSAPNNEIFSNTEGSLNLNKNKIQ